MRRSQHQAHQFGLTRGAGLDKDPMKMSPRRRNLDTKPVGVGLQAAAPILRGSLCSHPSDNGKAVALG
jgi:hypothetical protein